MGKVARSVILYRVALRRERMAGDDEGASQRPHYGITSEDTQLKHVGMCRACRRIGDSVDIPDVPKW